jgi:hypothetical protein
MPVSTFLGKAEALQKKGPMALLSKDIGRLKTEVEKGAKGLREERLAQEKAGRKPAYCPPENGGSINSTELLDHMRAIPAAQRDRVTVRDSLRGVLLRKYPCPA